MKEWKVVWERLLSVKPSPSETAQTSLSSHDWQWKDLESSWKKTAHDCVSYSGLFRLTKKKKIIIAECSGKQKAATSHLVTVRQTIDVPWDNINNLLTLLWEKATYSLRWSYVVLIIEHHYMQIWKAHVLFSFLYYKSGIESLLKPLRSSES